jgi:hypothetical protein
VLGRGLGERVQRLLATDAQHREAAVARDRVQPWAQPHRLVGRREVAVGDHERVLDGVLGLLHGPQHVAAEGEHAAVVAVVQRVERGHRPPAHLVHQALVPGQVQQACR